MSFKFTKNNLNFDVYTVASKPTAPGANNDIAIITSVPMSNWIMSPDKPSGTPRSDGDVWIQYSVTGNTFNALKNNSMMIATIEVWQYVDDVWTSVEAVSCRDGEWVNWIYWIVRDGTVVLNRLNGRLRDTSAFSVVHNDGYIRVYTTNSRTDGFTLDSPIDISDKTQVVLKCNVINPGANENIGVGLAKSLSISDYTDFKNNIVVKTKTANKGVQTLVCDISSFTGLYYPCFYADADTDSLPDLYVYDFYVE